MNAAKHKTLEQVRGNFVKAIRYEMELHKSIIWYFSLHDLKIDHNLDPRLVGKLLRRFKESVANTMPEFKVEYKPNFDFEIEIKRIK